MSKNRSSIILTPEIGLTSQLANDFQSVFGNRVTVLHSQLTGTIRRNSWLQLLCSEEPRIVIGPRSALFAPLRDVGLIVVDESHENAYKQDQAPHYHAVRVASKLAALQKAQIILGSATPPMTDYYMAQHKKRPIIRMRQIPARPGAGWQDTVKVIDLRDRSQFTKKSYFSDELIAAIIQTLDRGEQVLLFLNRRGTARVIFCEACGWQASCPRCDLPLVYHRDLHIMQCHSCNYRAGVPGSCPICHAPSIVFKSIGTKAIEDEVRRLFPAAKIQRFDTDNKKTERLERNYKAIKDGLVDIIVGTQTLAKGLDLPHLGLVGIIVADTSLYFPDFSASERTYQLISQVMGRVGRGHRAGHVIVQTYSPDSAVLKAALKREWDDFYNTELKSRRQFNFPPFCHLLKLTCRRASRISAQRAAEKLAQELAIAEPNVHIEGPTPSFHEKVQNKFQWQLVIKATQRSDLLHLITALPSGWTYDIDPSNLL